MGTTALEAGLGCREALALLLDFTKLCRVPFRSDGFDSQAFSEVYTVTVVVAVPFAVTVALLAT
jgi:hypothetical protein